MLPMKNVILFANIDNAFNVSIPPQVAFSSGANYDFLGRRFYVGVRFRY
jgi:hypothetical protein